MGNPNPSVITNEMWRMWEEASRLIPGVRLGGIYANKPGYHNTRNANAAGNYSRVVPLDLQGPGDKSAAIDLTMGDAEMRKRTGLLKAACLHAQDDRPNGMREFYGTLDSRNVYGLIQDKPGGPWSSSSSDSSHLWHVHISLFRAYTTNWGMIEPILSILSGETWEAWKVRKGNGGTPPPSGGGSMADYGPYGVPKGIENRTPDVLTADLWGQEQLGGSPYDKGASFRTQQLARIEAKLNALSSPTVDVDIDELADKVAARIIAKTAVTLSVKPGT